MSRSPVVILLAALVPSLFSGAPAPDPRDGYAVLERMHAAYAGRWYPALVFVQTTTFYKADGVRDTATWYESLKGPDQLRIDLGAPSLGRGVVLTAESSFVFRDGKVIRSDADGNPFLPLVMGVYLQAVDVTAKGAAHHGFDLAKTCITTWQGRRTFVVGAAAEADTASPQFWIDADRLVAVRMRVPLKTGGSLLDIQLSEYVPVGGGWLATHVSIAREGKPIQLEDYTEWSDAVPIPDALFDRTRWVTEGHWAAAPRAGSMWHRHSQ